MSLVLQLKTAATSLAGTLFRTALIADMTSIETTVNANEVQLNALQAAAAVAVWSSGGTYAAGEVVYSPTNFLNYRNKTGAVGTDPAGDATNWESMAQTAVEIHAATAKTTPVDADEIGYWDSVSSALRKMSWANIKTTLKTYFDTVYAALAGSITQVFSVGPATAAAHAVRLDQSRVAQDFRLSLTTGVPVTTADVTAATTIYCVPYTGNLIGLWNGTVFVNYATAEMSLALGTLVAGKAYDVFCYQNAGVPTLELGTAWTNDTTRAVALAYQNGILTKTGDATRRYLGTFYTTATTTTEDSAANRYVWNYYNRVKRAMRRLEPTASWTYTTAVTRQANGSTANQLNFLIGVAENIVSARVQTHVAHSVGGVAVSVMIGYDSVAAVSANCVYQLMQTPATAAYSGEFNAETSETPAAGRHYLAWLEYSVASGVTTWYGASTNGMIGEVMA